MPLPKCQQAFFFGDDTDGMQHTMVFRVVAAFDWLLLQLHRIIIIIVITYSFIT